MYTSGSMILAHHHPCELAIAPAMHITNYIYIYNSSRVRPTQVHFVPSTTLEMGSAQPPKLFRPLDNPHQAVISPFLCISQGPTRLQVFVDTGEHPANQIPQSKVLPSDDEIDSEDIHPIYTRWWRAWITNSILTTTNFTYPEFMRN